MTPSRTCRSLASAPSSSDASCKSAWRAVAAAIFVALAEEPMVVVAEVMPWLGTTAVSAEMSETCANGTSSSSATIWLRAARIPLPISTRPVRKVTLPSAAIRIQLSRSGVNCNCSSKLKFGLGGISSAASAMDRKPPSRLKPTTSAGACNNLRVSVLMARPPQLR